MVRILLLPLLLVAALLSATPTEAAKKLYNGVMINWEWESNSTTVPSQGKFVHTLDVNSKPITLSVSKWDSDASQPETMHDAFLRTLDDAGGNRLCYIIISDPTSATGEQVFLATSMTEFTNHFAFDVTWISGGATWWGPPLNRGINIAFIPVQKAGPDLGPPSGVKLWDTNGFRLTLASNVPDDEVDRVGMSTIYWTPYTSDAIALFDGANWNIRNVSQRSLLLSGLTANKNYDVFVYDNAGVPTLEIGPAWTNDTTRSTNIVRLNGVFVKSGAPTRRYVGSFRSTSSNTTESSHVNRYLYNYDNPLPTQLYAVGNSNHSYSSTATRLWGNSDALSTSRVLIGVGSQRNIDGNAGTYGYSGAGGDARILVCVDTNPSAFPLEAESTLVQSSQATWTWVEASRKRLPQGLVYIQLCQRTFAGSSNIYSWYVRNFSIPL